MGNPKDIVGHKTMRDGSHQPLYRDEADALRASHEAYLEKRAAIMPNEAAAIQMLFDAFDRLRELGWREAIYCPKDGSAFEVIEPGSTGIHRARYEGDWPTGSWWVECDEGGSPSHPCLFRLCPEDDAKRITSGGLTNLARQAPSFRAGKDSASREAGKEATCC